MQIWLVDVNVWERYTDIPSDAALKEKELIEGPMDGTMDGVQKLQCKWLNRRGNTIKMIFERRKRFYIFFKIDVFNNESDGVDVTSHENHCRIRREVQIVQEKTNKE